MSIWEPRDVTAARSVRIAVFVSDQMLAHERANIERHLARKFVLIAEEMTYGLVLDVEDVRHAEREPEPKLGMYDMVEFGFYWSPGPRPVEFIDGPFRGEGRRIRGLDPAGIDPAHWPIVRLPKPQRMTAADYTAEPTISTLPVVEYQPWGWNPTTRAWIYAEHKTRAT